MARIRALLREHKFEAVLAAAAGLRPDVAGARDGLLCVAVAQRYLHRIPAALQTLATLERHHPRFSRLYEERGRCYVELRQAPQAIEAFLIAVNINHALPGSWSMLEGLYRLTGQTGQRRAWPAVTWRRCAVCRSRSWSPPGCSPTATSMPPRR